MLEKIEFENPDKEKQNYWPFWAIPASGNFNEKSIIPKT